VENWKADYIASRPDAIVDCRDWIAEVRGQIAEVKSRDRDALVFTSAF